MEYLPTFTIDLCQMYIGEYTSPMDPMGNPTTQPNFPPKISASQFIGFPTPQHLASRSAIDNVFHGGSRRGYIWHYGYIQ